MIDMKLTKELLVEAVRYFELHSAKLNEGEVVKLYAASEIKDLEILLETARRFRKAWDALEELDKKASDMFENIGYHDEHEKLLEFFQFVLDTRPAIKGLIGGE